MNNHNAKVIDELNRRMEEADENGDTKTFDTLKSFYDWYIEEFIS